MVVSATDEGIYIENFLSYELCKSWLLGNVSLLALIEDEKGIFRE